ncbi:MAG: DNA repair protein RecO [Gammaproteobacteria bacterium]|nr:DNA repair protein RecO [Gammaproteobacteria bacterium]
MHPKKHKSSAFVIHRYPYQDSGFLLKIFSQEMGLLTLVAAHAKRPKSAWYGILQPFQPLLIQIKGEGEVQGLKQAEPADAAFILQGDALWSGFYLNELLLSFLMPHDPHPDLFNAYQVVLSALQSPDSDKALRFFELCLFREMGFLFDLPDEIIPDFYYQLQPHDLPQLVDSDFALKLPTCFRGADLLSIYKAKLDNEHILKVAKRFSRIHLDFYLPKAQLKTREIFKALALKED